MNRDLVSRTFSGAEVLIVDDDVQNLAQTAEMLTAKGMRVHIAENGFEGLSLVSSNPFSVILVDFILPDMTGRQFFDLVRTVLNTENKEKPVIFLAGERELESSVTLTASAVVVKPYTESVLISTLQPFFADECPIASSNGEKLNLPPITADFSRLMLITDGEASRMERFLSVYHEQFEILAKTIEQAESLDALPELRNVHHRAATGINLLQLHGFDAEVRRFRDHLRYKNQQTEKSKNVILKSISGIQEQISAKLAEVRKSL